MSEQGSGNMAAKENESSKGTIMGERIRQAHQKAKPAPSDGHTGEKQEGEPFSDSQDYHESFTENPAARSNPDADGSATRQGQATRLCKEYVCEYYHDGAWWGLEITAYDFRDAEARVAKLGNLKLKGELMAKIPACRGAGLFVKSLCACRNFLWRSSR